jgi:hypothetical protein
MERSEAISGGGASAGRLFGGEKQTMPLSRTAKRGSIATQQWARGDGRWEIDTGG